MSAAWSDPIYREQILASEEFEGAPALEVRLKMLGHDRLHLLLPEGSDADTFMVSLRKCAEWYGCDRHTFDRKAGEALELFLAMADAITEDMYGEGEL